MDNMVLILLVLFFLSNSCISISYIISCQDSLFKNNSAKLKDKMLLLCFLFIFGGWILLIDEIY